MQLRIARHTHNLEQIRTFYLGLPGFVLLGEFKDHDHYDGIFIGTAANNWHLEFTTSHEKVPSIFGEDDNLVFYPESQSEYDAFLDYFAKNETQKLVPKNPYWRKNGILFHDPDGYHLIVSPLKIRP